MFKMKWQFIFFLGLLIFSQISLISSLNNETIISCGGDSETIIACYGNNETFIYNSEQKQTTLEDIKALGVKNLPKELIWFLGGMLFLLIIIIVALTEGRDIRISKKKRFKYS